LNSLSTMAKKSNLRRMMRNPLPMCKYHYNSYYVPMCHALSCDAGVSLRPKHFAPFLLSGSHAPTMSRGTKIFVLGVLWALIGALPYLNDRIQPPHVSQPHSYLTDATKPLVLCHRGSRYG
jgi:hypothetical protein